jgi:hypothetical protein
MWFGSQTIIGGWQWRWLVQRSSDTLQSTLGMTVDPSSECNDINIRILCAEELQWISPNRHAHCASANRRSSECSPPVAPNENLRLNRDKERQFALSPFNDRLWLCAEPMANRFSHSKLVDIFRPNLFWRPKKSWPLGLFTNSNSLKNSGYLL